MSDREGPRVTIEMSCSGCKHERSESYQAQGDSGHRVYCAQMAPRRYVGDTTWKTPEWCPFRAVVGMSADEFRAFARGLAAAASEPDPRGEDREAIEAWRGVAR